MGPFVVENMEMAMGEVAEGHFWSMWLRVAY